jgi:acetate kinase
MPRLAKMLPLPRRFEKAGIQRYGFHGLSYAWLMEELTKNNEEKGKIILAHLGSGASMAAVKNGVSIDTTMGFTPTGGLVMSERTGDMDPGVAAWLMQTAGLTVQQYNHLINHESGLLGISETSGDVQELLQQEEQDIRAKEAIDFFCYNARKWIGALTATLGGLDTLVFSGGIGENAAIIRARICDGLQYLGIFPDEGKNNGHARNIAAPNSAVKLYVIPTDEEQMIAKLTTAVYEQSIKSKPSPFK